MLILAVDTTHKACSAAIYDTEQADKQGGVCGYQYDEMPKGHAEKLPEMIHQTLAASGVSFNQIGKIVATTGPGSFSGVRIGLSAAKGFALSLDLPLVGIGSLEAVAAGVEVFLTSRVLAAFDARRNEIYVQLFENGQSVTQPDILTPQEAALLAGDQTTIIVGSACDILMPLNTNLIKTTANDLPDARVAARLGAKRKTDGPVHPIYLRRADAKAQKPLLQVRPSAVTLIDATSAHCEILAEIHRQGFVDHWSGQSIAASLQTPTTKGLIAVDESQNPLGFILVRDGAHEREILTIAVQNHARRRKIASTLLKQIITDATQEKIENIFLEVNTENFSARALYDGFGFEVCGTRKNYYTSKDGQKQDAWVMSKTI